MRQRIIIKCSKCNIVIGSKMGVPNRKGSASQYLCRACTTYKQQTNTQSQLEDTNS